MNTVADTKLSLTEFARKAGISISYASQLVTDKPEKRRTPTPELAAIIYSRTGVMLGLLEGATTREANAFVRMLERTGKINAS